MGWYLRLSRAEVIEVLVQDKALAALEEAVRIQPHWELAAEAADGFSRAVFTRRPREDRP